MDKETLANSYGEFTWNFGSEFLIRLVDDNGEITGENYVWSCPGYNGTGEIKEYTENPANFTHEGFMGRSKGRHLIRYCCGDFTFAKTLQYGPMKNYTEVVSENGKISVARHKN